MRGVAILIAPVLGFLLAIAATAAAGAAPLAAGTPNAAEPAQQPGAPHQASPPLWPAPAPLPPGGCTTEIAGARDGAPSAYVVQLDADTLWRPAGAQVRFTIAQAGPAAAAIKRVTACFRWEPADLDRPGRNTLYAPSPLLGSVPTTESLVRYAALIPNFGRPHQADGPRGADAGTQYTAAGTVPLADMQVLVELQDNTWFAVILPVGITRVWTALVKLALAVGLACAALWACAPKALLVGAGRWDVSRRILAVISARNGVASLSQFQIVLWCFVVGGAAVYVMSLSGNLISISNGTLVLLGIAGGTSVLARIKPITQSTSPDPPPDPAPHLSLDPPPIAAALPPPPARIPRWSDILVDDAERPEIDVTRVQMLMFTLISATYVGIKVAVSYTVPEIPDNFLLLLGISNGVYLAGRQIPNTPKGTTP